MVLIFFIYRIRLHFCIWIMHIQTLADTLSVHYWHFSILKICTHTQKKTRNEIPCEYFPARSQHSLIRLFFSWIPFGCVFSHCVCFVYFFLTFSRIRHVSHRSNLIVCVGLMLIRIFSVCLVRCTCDQL